jgi:hypothetical protein
LIIITSKGFAERHVDDCDVSMPIRVGPADGQLSVGHVTYTYSVHILYFLPSQGAYFQYLERAYRVAKSGTVGHITSM